MNNLIVIIIMIFIIGAVNQKIYDYYKKKGTNGDSVRIFVVGALIFIFLVIKFFMITSKY